MRTFIVVALLAFSVNAEAGFWSDLFGILKCEQLSRPTPNPQIINR